MNTNEVSDTELEVLRVFNGIKAYARGPLLEGKATEVEAMVSRGLIKRNKIGATSITKQGEAIVQSQKGKRRGTNTIVPWQNWDGENTE